MVSGAYPVVMGVACVPDEGCAKGID